jgi:DNA-binding response OmpR family regulator
MKILLIEDDMKLSSLIERAFSEKGHVVDCVQDGIAGENAALDERYEAVIIDVMLPSRDGLSIVRNLRAKGRTQPIIFLTARDTTQDVIAGLEAGADDYIRKPFDLEELEARIRTIVRRTAHPPPNLFLEVGGVALDLVNRIARRGDREIELRLKEMALLECFMRNPGVTLSREAISHALWGRDAEILSNVVDVYVARLRSKLDRPDLPPLIRTIRGYGYRFETR